MIMLKTREVVLGYFVRVSIEIMGYHGNDKKMMTIHFMCFKSLLFFSYNRTHVILCLITLLWSVCVSIKIEKNTITDM